MMQWEKCGWRWGRNWARMVEEEASTWPQRDWLISLDIQADRASRDIWMHERVLRLIIYAGLSLSALHILVYFLFQ